MGTLAIGGAAQQIPTGANAGNVNINGFGALNLGGFSQQVNGLIGASGAVVDGISGTPTLTVGNNNATGAYDTFGGVIKNTAGTLNLAKVGLGTLTLQGANTYTGTTTVSAGQVTVSGAGTLATTGLTVASGATFNYLPTTVGLLTLGTASTLNLTGGSAIGLALTTTSGSNDGIKVLGAATVSGVVNIDISGGVGHRRWHLHAVDRRQRSHRRQLHGDEPDELHLHGHPIRDQCNPEHDLADRLDERLLAGRVGRQPRRLGGVERQHRQ